MNVYAELRALDAPDAPPLFETGPHPDRTSALEAVANHISASPAADDRIADDGSNEMTVYDSAGTPTALVTIR
ncbi:hypothetical protein [Gordonia sihwensis]|uniref:hypothetical protein n=1 Tax=Gordonia sihwensis TaxID=173559 RepID=UPI003D96BA40